jgi:hypothetical protein
VFRKPLRMISLEGFTGSDGSDAPQASVPAAPAWEISGPSPSIHKFADELAASGLSAE